MNDGRLGIVTRNVRAHRKQNILRNAQAKWQLDTLSKQLEREKSYTSLKLERSLSPVKVKYVEGRYVGKCLKKRRSNPDFSREPSNLGCYEGEPMRIVQAEARDMMAENHPSHRRRRKSEELLSAGIQRGKLISPELALERFNTFMKRPMGRSNKDSRKPDTGFTLPPLIVQKSISDIGKTRMPTWRSVPTGLNNQEIRKEDSVGISSYYSFIQ